MWRLWLGYPLWAWIIASVFLGFGALQLILSVFRLPGRLRHDKATYDLCAQRGMWPADNFRPPNMPDMLPLIQAGFRNTFATPDMSLWYSEVRDSGSALSSTSVAMLMFEVDGLNLPYVAAARKGDVSVLPRARGQEVGFESIDFMSCFEIRADDPRAAVMLIDQGMMQWLLDLDRVSFQISGPLVSALVNRRRNRVRNATELELLLQFRDGFAAHVSAVVRMGFPAPMAQPAR